MQQQAPVTHRVRIQVAPGAVSADMAVNQPHFAVPYYAITVLEVGLAFTNRLHFRSRQFDASFELLQEMIVMRSLPVDGKILDRRWRRFPGHGSSRPAGPTTQAAEKFLRNPEALLRCRANLHSR